MKTIELNGLTWDTENLVIDGKTHFSYSEAKIEATKLGKRLPTKDEFKALLNSPHVFDHDKLGMWFAKKAEDLKTEKSLFLPVSGMTFGSYWSCTQDNATSWYVLYFNDTDVNLFSYYRFNCLSVRCVAD